MFLLEILEGAVISLSLIGILAFAGWAIYKAVKG